MFRFTIRDLLWLTVVVAMAVAWWVVRGRLVEEIKFYSTHLQIRPGVWVEF